ncbi:hypothetical protein GP486_003758 [Trichoglossum hirsutum]|uniref:Chaperone/heat shock protein Hsp12 n=1 Tax=Trichoglossum hirsutum TaxID=265104 RepID=A0A9P8LCF7_9PEZI|nr:hypothetical protein GP486_003758 [Trichoglossum hirsutum]
MSDLGRKDFSTKAREQITPDSSKSTMDKVKESATDTADRIARGVKSDEHKSGTQELQDKVQRTTDHEGHGGTVHSV